MGDEKPPIDQLDHVAMKVLPFFLSMSQQKGLQRPDGMVQVGFNLEQACVMAFQAAGTFVNVARQVHQQFLEQWAKMKAEEEQRRIVTGASKEKA